LPEHFLSRGRTGKAVYTKTARQHALHIAIKDRRARPEGKDGDRRRRRAADAGQFGELLGIGRKLSAMLRGNLLRAFMQVARAGVIAQPGPMLDDRLDRRRGQRRHGRKTVEKTQVIRNHRGHLRLLQHDLGKPDAVRVTRVLPGQVMAAGALLPGDQSFGKGLAGGQILPRLRLREHG